MEKEFARYKNVAEAICKLLYPHAEVVIHNFQTGCIEAIFNSLSMRKAGDDSLISFVLEQDEIADVFEPYAKKNYNGNPMKSTSAAIRDETGKPVGLLCINLELSLWTQMQDLLSGWLAIPDVAHSTFFKNDWREQINNFVSSYLREKGTTLRALTKEQRRDLVQAIYREGGFKAKHAASYIGDVLNLSRASIYNYLRHS